MIRTAPTDSSAFARRPSFGLPPIYPITDRAISGLSHLEQVKRLAAGGATFIQLRDKSTDGRTFFEAAREVLEFARPRGVRIIINDRVDVALAVGADGVHVGQDDLPPEAVRRVLGPDAIVGFSTHSLDQAREADRLPVDYVAVGPVFSTRTKENPSPVVGVELVRRAAAAISKPLVAIGGVTLDSAPTVLDAGAASVAVISDLLSHSETLAGRLETFLRNAGKI